jgi:hypothetical protein
MVAVADMTATNKTATSPDQSLFKDTMVIVYPPGGYGTFLEWCLNYFTGRLPVGEHSWPFGANGSAHRFLGNQITRQDQVLRALPGFDTFDEYLKTEKTVKFARTHGFDFTQTTEPHDVQNLIIKHQAHFTQFMYVQSRPDALLLLLNNMAEKILRAPGVITASRKYVTDNMDTWEVRESISFWFPEFVQWLKPYYPILQVDNCVVVELRDLLSDLESVLDKIFTATKLEWSPVHREGIDSLIEKWLSLQKHVNKDAVCQAIVNSIINSTHYDWRDQQLTMYDEAFIQWALRDLHGLDMKCYNVNVFPTNTTDLRNLLINE